MPHAIEDCYGSRLHCMSHDEDEPDDPCYRACYECKHVYGSPEELQAEWERGYRSCDPLSFLDEDSSASCVIVVPAAEEIFFCPLCMHDF